MGVLGPRSDGDRLRWRCLLALLLLPLLFPAAPALAEDPSAAPAAAPQPTFPLPFPSEAAFEKTFEGAIDGKYAFTMTLKKDGRSLAGRYRYKSQEKDLRLTGEIDPEANFLLTEFDGEKETGVFVGRFAPTEGLYGQWYRGGDLKKPPLSFVAGQGHGGPDEEERQVLAMVQGLRLGKISLDRAEECGQILAGLKAGTAEWVRPFVRTEHWENPILQAVVGQCPDLALDTGSWGLPRYLHTEPHRTQAHFGFAAYLVDIDRDAANGKEYVIRSGGHQDVEKLSDAGNHDRYRIVDLSTCSERYEVMVSHAFDRPAVRREGYYNGLLRVAGETYVYSLEGTYLELSRRRTDRRKPGVHTYCSYLKGE